MKPALALNKPDKVLLIFSSIFLIITSLLSLWFIFIIINQDIEFEFQIILTLIAALFIIGLTLWTNSVILSRLELLRKKEININIVICLIQSFSLYMNGFRFKYLQGLDCILFLYVDQTMSRFEPGITLPRPGFEFVFSFLSTEGIFFGVNIFALILAFFFIYLKRKYLKNIEVR